MEKITSLFDQVSACFSELQKWRRYFHTNPELGYQEFHTAETITCELKRFGLNVTEHVGQTGVVGLLEGKSEGPAILLRFEMDALPIQEQNQVEYASRQAGVMHACGHDGNLAVGLVCARLLSNMRDDLKGSIKFVFQPAEEGLGGAKSMVTDGVLSNPKPDYSLTMHVWNERPLGTVILHPGPYMASADFFTITVHGKGGHGALPELTADSILAGATILTSLQSIVSHNVSPLKQAVVSITQFHGGDAPNVVPEQVVLGGSIRAFLPEVRTLIFKRVAEIADLTANAMGCTAGVVFTPVTPAVINHADLTRRVMAICAKELPACEVDTEYQTMASDDMAEFMNDIPGCYIMVGSANLEKGLVMSHHHARFDFDEQALVYGGVMIMGAVKELLK